MAAELSIRENIKKALLLGADLSSLDGDRSWYRNGDRGHLHLEKYCYRLSDSFGANIVTFKASETKSKICPICFTGNLSPEDFKTFESIQTLNRASDYAVKSADLLSKPVSASVAVRNLKVCIKNVNSITAPEFLHDAINKVLAVLNLALLEAQKHNSGSQENILRHAALGIISGEYAPEAIHNLRVVLGKHQEELIYEKLWRIWSSFVEEGETFANAAKYVTNEFANASAISIKQLEYSAQDLKNKLELNTDKSVKEILKEVWREDTLKKLIEQITVWETLFTNQMNSVDLKAVSIPAHSSLTDKWLSAIIGTWELHKGTNNGQLIKLPNVVAQWFAREINNYTTYRSQAVVHDLLPQDSDDTLLTALTLWMPDTFRNTEFSTFEKALVAARNI